MKQDKRKTCICNRCGKDKLHFGLGMCSACLRHTKRETRPSFYLGTCYSEMSRRVKTFDPLRPNYFGKKLCTKEEFIEKFINDKDFLNQYKIWQESNFKRGSSPSIDRIDNDKDYTLDNLRFVSHKINSTKDVIKKVKDSYGNIFPSQVECANFYKISPATVCKYIKENKTYRGVSFENI